eukprot:535481_1
MDASDLTSVDMYRELGYNSRTKSDDNNDNHIHLKLVRDQENQWQQIGDYQWQQINDMQHKKDKIYLRDMIRYLRDMMMIKIDHYIHKNLLVLLLLVYQIVDNIYLLHMIMDGFICGHH